MAGPIYVEHARTYPMPPSVKALRFAAKFVQRTVYVCAALGLIIVAIGVAIEASELSRQVPRVFDAYIRTAVGVLGLGGVFGLLAVNAIVNDIALHLIRKQLNTFALPENRNDIPVYWQRRAIESNNRYLGVLGVFLLSFGGLGIIFSLYLLSGNVEYTLETFLVSATLTGLGVYSLRGFKPFTGPAVELWGGRSPRLHRREKQRRNEEGVLVGPSRAELRNSPQAKAELAAAPASILRLARLERVGTVVNMLAMLGFVISGLLTALGTYIRQPCRGCRPRRLEPAGEAFLTQLLTVALVTLLVSLIVLVLGVVVQAFLHLRLRQAMLQLADEPDSAPPPWLLLREVILEEAPIGSITQHLHTLGIVAFSLGASGWLTAGVPPLDEWLPWFQRVVLVGVGLLVLYALSWFQGQDQALQQAERLRDRW